MKKNSQTTRLGLSILLILTAFSVNAETPQTTASQVKYNYYYLGDLAVYRSFLPPLASKELHYQIRMVAEANINDTPEKEKVVLIVAQTKRQTADDQWLQAFLLIIDPDRNRPKKKDLFKLFDVSPYDLEVPAAKVVELHASPFVFKKPTNIFFRLVDLTDDGTLDIWVESAYGVALISFENGAFKEVFSNYTVTREKLTETPEIEYYHYYNTPLEPHGRMYLHFLPALTPKERYYSTRMAATANINDTPERENIVLITADTGVDGPQGDWVRAFLLIVENEADMLKKKDLFKLFDVSPYDFDVPAKTVELQSAPFVFREAIRIDPWQFGIAFSLVDLTGDGILDVWVESAYGVVVISFQNGEFVEVCSAYTSSRRKDPIEYIDIDKDGIYEIKVPDRISTDGPTGAHLSWMSFYEWDGNTYVLNNERFYAENDAFLRRLLDQYNTLSHYSRNEVHHFYIGLVYAYRDNAPMAREFLQRVVEHGKKQDYIQAAESTLKKLPHH